MGHMWWNYYKNGYLPAGHVEVRIMGERKTDETETQQNEIYQYNFGRFHIFVNLLIDFPQLLVCVSRFSILDGP